MRLFQALVHVKALQDRCVAKEEVVDRVRKHNTNLMNEHGQYKEAICMLNKEINGVKTWFIGVVNGVKLVNLPP